MSMYMIMLLFDCAHVYCPETAYILIAIVTCKLNAESWNKTQLSWTTELILQLTKRIWSVCVCNDLITIKNNFLKIRSFDANYTIEFFVFFLFPSQFILSLFAINILISI